MWLLLLIVGLTAGWYFGWFGKTRDVVMNLSGSTANSDQDTGIVSEAVSGAVSQLGRKISQPHAVKNQISSFFQTAASVPKNFISGAASGIKNSVVTSAKEELSSVLHSLEEGLGVAPLALDSPTPAPVNEPPLIMTVVFSRGKSVRFIVAAAGRGQAYTIDWGDGRQENGRAAAGERKIIEHAWLESGSYAVTAIMDDGAGRQRRFSFPVGIE